MKFPALETKELNTLCSAVVTAIKHSKEGEIREPDLTFGEDSFLDDLRDDDRHKD